MKMLVVMLSRSMALLLLIASFSGCMSICHYQVVAPESVTPVTETETAALPAVPGKSGVAEEPCPTPVAKAVGTDEIPRFASDSPFDVDYEPPVVKEGKRLWANSILWDKAPDFVVEKWLSEKPETKGKVTLIEFWATWCGPCRRSIPLLNTLHEKYGDELAVIGVSDETEADVRKLKEPKIDYFSAIDTKARMKSILGVYGIPHVIIVEPEGYVVWEGFPLLKDYELTEELVERILKITRESKAEASTDM